VLVVFLYPYVIRRCCARRAFRSRGSTLECSGARDQSELSATVPFIAFGVTRYLYLVHRDDLGEEPEEVLLQDTPTLFSVALWALTAMWILALS
jgi:hypothetical protein